LPCGASLENVKVSGTAVEAVVAIAIEIESLIQFIVERTVATIAAIAL
jgi:hypothetical protein